MTETALGLIGVMTGHRRGKSSIAEPSFCSRLCQAAPLYNLGVLIFHPDGVAADGKTVKGYTWEDGSWQSTLSGPPDIVYNRCFNGSTGGKRKASAAMAALPRTLPWSRTLPNKWAVYEILKQYKKTASLLPETKPYSGSKSLRLMLEEREYGVFLKPKAGSHGKRTLHAILDPKGPYGLRIRGRDQANAPFHYIFDSQEDGLSWVHDFIGSRRYIMQPFLQLTNHKGQPFDVRVLMQKNGRGLWTLTGMAVRLGSPGSLTSNLHGGATAVPLLPFLIEEYGRAGKDIKDEIAAEAALLPPLLESACGRLGELGLDFGIDGGGRIHLLEVNSKPGRTVFQLTGDIRALKLATENPLRYARHLLLTHRRTPTLPEASSVTSGRMISMVPKEDS